MACLAAVLGACGAESSTDGDPTGPDVVDEADGVVGAEDGSSLDDIEDSTRPDAESPRDSGRLDIPFVDTGASPEDPAADVEEERDLRPTLPDLSFDDPPLIDWVTPPEGSTGGGDLVVVEGARFTWDIEVRLGGVIQTRIDVMDEFTLAFTTEPLPAGVHDLKLVTPGGSATLERAFRAVAPTRVESIEPAVGGLAGGETAVLTGSGFTETTRVFVGAREAEMTRWIDDTRVEVRVPPGPRAGAFDVVAVGERPATLAEGYRYVAGPLLRALVPSVGPVAGGTTIRLDGQAIDADCVLFVGERSASIRLSDEGWPEAVLPPGSAGTVMASLDCGARGEALLPSAFRYVATTSAGVVRVWPPNGFTSGGDVVTLSGFELDSVTAVWFGAEEARILQTSSDRVDVLSPPGGPGAVDVRVDSDRGAEILPTAWTWLQRPSFDALDPARGAGDVDWLTTVRGTGLGVVEAWELDGRTLGSSGGTDVSVDLSVPPGAGGPARLFARVGVLRVDSGLDVLRAGSPRVDRFSPPIVPIAGGSRIHILGDGFDRSCAVLIDGSVVATEVVSAGLLRVTAPPSDAGLVGLEVQGCVTWEASPGLRYYDPSRLPAGVQGGAIDGELRVSVLESGTNAPIEGASVMVSVRDTSPWVALTDVRGQVVFTDEELVGPQTVSAFAPGRSAESYVNVDANEVTFLLAQLPTPPCDPSDPECQPPPPPPRGSIQGFLTGLAKTTDPPPGTRLWATIETTRLSPGFVNPDPGPLGQLAEDGAFSINSRLGDVALIALCGYRYDAPPNEFVPLTMGVTRGIALRPDRPNARATVDCNIPLDQSVTVKLAGAPQLIDPEERPGENPWPGRYQARFTFDFGGEGVFESLRPLVFRTNIYTGGAFPRLSGPLAGVRFDAVAGVYPRLGNTPAAEAWLHNVSRFGDDLVFPELLAIPRILLPNEANPRLVDGYIEWEMDPLSRDPDYFYIFATSPGGGFPRWAVYVPGSARSFHFADYPAFADGFGTIPRPGRPSEALSLFVRATDAVVFDFDDFDRVSLRASTWKAASTAFLYLPLVPTGGIGDPTVP